MYIPKHFRVTDQAEILNFLRKNSFGALVTHYKGKFEATHIPFMLSDDGTSLHGHIALGNNQKHAIKSGEKAFFIIQGPHAYISSTWYNHENVPTWNYQAVHLHGQIQPLTDTELLTSLKQLVDVHEHGRNPNFTIEQMSTETLSAQMKGIIGFRFIIESIEAKYKLSQNRDKESFNNVINALESEQQPNTVEVAAAMRKLT